MPDFSALYLPARESDEPNPSRSGFESQEAAEEYIFAGMCGSCKQDRQAALDGVEMTEEMENQGIFPSLWPGCACEWVVVPTEKANGTFPEIMEAAGWKPVDFMDTIKEVAGEDDEQDESPTRVQG